MHILISGRLLLGKTKLILAMDQGTTSSRALVFEPNGHIASQKQAEFAQHYPANGWVEHSPQDILKTSLETATNAVQQAEAQGARVVSIGITNQRETVVIWDRDVIDNGLKSPDALSSMPIFFNKGSCTILAYPL